MNTIHWTVRHNGEGVSLLQLRGVGPTTFIDSSGRTLEMGAGQTLCIPFIASLDTFPVEVKPPPKRRRRLFRTRSNH